MGRNQIIVLSIAIVSILVMYFGCDHLPPSQKDIDQTRAMNFTSTDITNLNAEAKASLKASDLSDVLAFESMVTEEIDSSTQLENLQALSAKWFELNRTAISAYYAEQIAQKVQTEDAWSIAGTTYSICLQREKESKTIDFCKQGAVNAFEMALGIDPEDVNNRINLALVYVESPTAQQPMQGILMLRDLSEKYPENASVQFQLGRLALMTNQLEKAIERLSNAYRLNPEDKRISCLLAETYKKIGQTQKYEEFAKKCAS